MAACGGIEHIFEKPLPETPALLESLSPWERIKPVNTVAHSSFTEIFAEFFRLNNNHHSNNNDHHHDVHPDHSPVSSDFSSPTSFRSSNFGFYSIPNTPLSPIDILNANSGVNLHVQEKNGSPSASSESLSICTEGLGLESFDDAEDFMNHAGRTPRFTRKPGNHWGDRFKRSRTGLGSFPPPISCIGGNGRPCVDFKSVRQDGRFILKEIRIPNQELLHACRENGRLKLHFIQSSDDEILEEDEEEDEEYEELSEGNNDDRGKDDRNDRDGLDRN